MSSYFFATCLFFSCVGWNEYNWGAPLVPDGGIADRQLKSVFSMRRHVLDRDFAAHVVIDQNHVVMG